MPMAETALDTKKDRKLINGIPTDIAVSMFADRVFIAVIQLGTFGTLVVHISRSAYPTIANLVLQVEAHQKNSVSGKFQADIHVRLGRRDDPLLLVYARQFLEHFGAPVGLPILAAIGLKDRSSDTFEVVMQTLKKLFGQAVGSKS
ncbi:hypothetical protein PsorP6_005101 [Peronosclerospora sorghi]|uniref:Uncharacterized protein n=1 Tax=Peronosclerospora sorghi TaxID=230839 RepID=A0ACC0W1Z9_9STRA|nr:hypothetical protein PsorP6_005101 [Peronosclerospora sorghi]